MQFNVQNPVLSIGWSSTTTRALQTVTSASNGWLAAVTVDSELLIVAPSGESASSEGSGSTLCFSNSAENIVCASASSIDVRSMPDGQTVASLSELGTARADDTAAVGAGPEPHSRAPIVAKHPLQDIFAAAKGRNVRLFGLDAKEKADIGPLNSEVKGLEWASDGHLYVQVDSAILVASADGETVRPVQEVQEDGTIVAFALSPSGTHLAASIHTPGDNQVDIQLLQKDLTSDAGAMSTNLTSFHQYDDTISCLAWDQSGRFLATGDCGEATIWDVDLVRAGAVIQNIICCGHCQNSSIQHMAFSPDDSVLATAGTDGQVLLFDTALFQEGTLVSAFAKLQAAPAGSDMMHLAWTSDTSLVMATRSGIMASLKLEGCPMKEMYGNAIPAAIIPATPTRIPHNTSMERMSSYSNNGTGSGSNSDTEAHNTCTHSSSRAEPGPQVQAPADGNPALPKLEVKTKVQQPAEGHENSDVSKQSAQKSSKLSAESPEYTPTAAVSKGTLPAEDIVCNGTIEEEPAELPVDDQESSSSKGSTGKPQQAQPEPGEPVGPGKPSTAALLQPVVTPRPLVRSSAKGASAPAGRGAAPLRSNGGPPFRRPANVCVYQKPQEEYLDRQHSIPQRAHSFPRGSTRATNGFVGGTDGTPAHSTPLSPGLLQRMQAIKENPQLGHQSPQRSQLAGWGPGPLQPMASTQHRPMHFKGMPMAPQMSPMAFAPPGMNTPHGFMPLMPQQALPFTVPPSGAPPSPMRGRPPGMAQPLMTGAAPPPGTPAFQPGCPPGGPNMFHGALPQGQPYIMVSAGAQPPQGWIPVMPSNWMTMYGGHMIAPGPPMSPHMGPAGSGGPDSYPFAAPWSGRPGDDAGMNASPGLTHRPMHRSLPASMGRMKFMPPAPRPPTSGPPSRAPDHRPGFVRDKEESQGSNHASETGSNAAEGHSTADSVGKAAKLAHMGFPEGMPPPAFAYPAPGAMLAPPAELLMTEGSPDSPPQPVTTLYVGNLPPGVDEQILFHTFRAFGHIPDIQVIRDKITNHSRGFAFVTFSHPAAASCAHAQLNGVTMYGPFSGRALRLGPSNRTAAAAEE